MDNNNLCDFVVAYACMDYVFISVVHFAYYISRLEYTGKLNCTPGLDSKRSH